MDENKQKFLEALNSSYGIIAEACEAMNMSRSTFYRWCKSDEAFKEQVDDVTETQIDYVESKLIKNISAGDTTAIIFYLKTKGKKRGWTEKQQSEAAVNNEARTDAALSAPPAEKAVKTAKAAITKRIKNKKDYIVKLLRQQGKYTAELSMQVTITAQLLVKTEMLAEEVLAEEHESVNVEISREGNERKTISPKEKLYLDFVQQSQKALRALGMNTDAKERKTENDTFNEFLKEFGDNE